MAANYSKLERLLMSEFNLIRYDYPRPVTSDTNKAEIANEKKNYTQIDNPFERSCKRCDKSYKVQETGSPVIQEQCKYHPYRMPRPGVPYRCCNGTRHSDPCMTASQHVTDDNDLNNLTGFIYTKNNISVATKEAYALDCEMIFADTGMEVGALSVVNSNCEVVYETKVKPDSQIVDYNAEFSGLSEEHFNDVTTTLKDVHYKLLTLFGPNTILVGHGSSHDLLCLKIIHDKVVDTVVTYPHSKGYPFLNSLQYIKERYLPYNSHNTDNKCRDDAIAAMKLALLK